MIQEELEKQFELACNNGDLTELKRLVNNGFDFHAYFEEEDKENDSYNNKVIYYGKNAILKGPVALWNATANNHIKVMDYLFEVMPLLEKHKVNILENACSSGNLDIIRHIADKDSKFITNTLFHIACEQSHLDIIKYFIERKGSLNNDSINNVLISGSKKGHVELVRYAISQDADINEDGSHAMSLACGRGHLEVVKCFVKNGFNTVEKINYGFSLACDSGQIETAKYFVSLGADISKHEKEFVIWCHYGHSEIIDYCIFELNIPLTPKMKRLFKKDEDNFRGIKDEVYKMFKVRDLNQKLNNALPNSIIENNDKRTKI